MLRDQHLCRLRSARERLSVVETALLRPSADTWRDCTPKLEEAARLLGGIETEIRAESAWDLEERTAIRKELEALRRDLRRVTALLESASSYYSGLAELFALSLRGYSPEGRVVPFTTPVQVCLEA